MTEFELAQLELMETARAQGLLELAQGQGALLQTDSIQFTTLLFSYLLVAYFIGSKLSRVQVLILNTLYLLSMGAIMFQLFGNAAASLGFLEKFYEVTELSREVTALNPNFLTFGFIYGFVVILTSLYFMWSVRHPKTE